MNITKQLPKEIVKYIPSVIPLVALPFFPDMSPEVLAIFGTSMQNCIDIISKASNLLNKGADICEIDVDWRANFFDKGRLVSDDNMQILWAKILAGEANKPGTCSKRCISFVADMDKREAELFENLCQYVCEIKNDGNTELVLLLFPYDDFPYPMPDEGLNHLDSIGLIRLDDYPNEIFLHKPIEVSYYGKSIHLGLYLEDDKKIPNHLKSVRTSHIKLTQIGKELCPMARSTGIVGLLDYVCREVWEGYIRTKKENL